MNLRDLNPLSTRGGVVQALMVWALTVGAADADTANVLHGDMSFESGSPGGHFVIGTTDAGRAFREADPALTGEAVFDRSTGVHGTSSIRLDLRPGSVAALRFEAPKAVQLPCTASAYVRGGKGSANIRLEVADNAAGLIATEEMRPPNYWRRVIATLAASEGNGLDGRTVQPVITIAAESEEEASVWIDAVQLEGGAEATAFAMAFPLTYGIRRPDEGPLVTTVPLRLTAHVVNDTEYIAVCRVVARLYPVEDDLSASAASVATAVAEAEARVGMAPRQGKDAPLDFGTVPAGRYMAVVNRADGPPEEEARIFLTVEEGPPLSISGEVAAGDPAGVNVTIANESGDPIDGNVNVWLGPRPVQLEPVAIRLEPGGSLTREFQLPKTYDEVEARLRVETSRGAAEIAIPVPAAPGATAAVPSP